MVLNNRVVRELRSALLEQASRPLVYAPLVEDPAESVRDVRVLGRGLLGPLGELERLLLVAAVFRVEPGKVVRRGREAWVQRQDLLVRLLGFYDVSLALVDYACKHLCGQI